MDEKEKEGKRHGGKENRRKRMECLLYVDPVSKYSKYIAKECQLSELLIP